MRSEDDEGGAVQHCLHIHIVAVELNEELAVVQNALSFPSQLVDDSWRRR